MPIGFPFIDREIASEFKIPALQVDFDPEQFNTAVESV